LETDRAHRGIHEAKLLIPELYVISSELIHNRLQQSKEASWLWIRAERMAAKELEEALFLL
jgi:hypothetical protein